MGATAVASYQQTENEAPAPEMDVEKIKFQEKEDEFLEPENFFTLDKDIIDMIKWNVEQFSYYSTSAMRSKLYLSESPLDIGEFSDYIVCKDKAGHFYVCGYGRLFPCEDDITAMATYKYLQAKNVIHFIIEQMEKHGILNVEVNLEHGDYIRVYFEPEQDLKDKDVLGKLFNFFDVSHLYTEEDEKESYFDEQKQSFVGQWDLESSTVGEIYWFNYETGRLYFNFRIWFEWGVPKIEDFQKRTESHLFSLKAQSPTSYSVSFD